MSEHIERKLYVHALDTIADLRAINEELVAACRAVVHAAESDNETGNSDIYGEVATCIDAIEKARGEQ